MTDLSHGGPTSAYGLTDHAPIAPLDVTGLLRVVWQGKWLISLCVAVFVLLAGYYAFHIAQPRYGASATVQITPAQDGVSTQGTASPPLQQAALSLTGRSVLAGVIASSDLLNDPEFNRYLQPLSPLSPNAIRTSLRHLIAGTAPVPPDAAAIMEKTIDNLRAAITVGESDETGLQTIQVRSASPEKAVDLANAVIATFIAETQQQQLATLNTRADWLTRQRARLRDTLTTQETAINALIAAAQVQDDAGLDQLSDALQAVEGSLLEAQTTLSNLQSPDPAQNARQSTLLDQETLVNDLTMQRDRLRAEVDLQSAGLVRLQQLQRDADATRTIYRDTLTAINQIAMQRDQASTANPVQIPATTARCLGPRKLWILQAAALLGLLAGLMLVALRHANDKGITSRQALADATALPVLADTPRLMLREGRLLRRALAKGANGPLAPTLRAIRSRLMLAVDGRMPAVILCTSSVTGEGAAAHAATIASLLVRNGKRVLLVRADERSTIGLADVMAGRATVEDAINWDTRHGCDILCMQGAAMADDPTHADGFAAVLACIAGHYDHTIIAARPVLADPATLLWAQQADAVLLAVRHDKTPLPIAHAALAELARAKAPVKGTFLTGAPRARSRHAATQVASRRLRPV